MEEKKYMNKHLLGRCVLIHLFLVVGLFETNVAEIVMFRIGKQFVVAL